MTNPPVYYLVEVWGSGYAKTADIHTAALLLSYRRPLWRLTKQWEYEQRRRDDLAERLNRSYDIIFVDVDEEFDTERFEPIEVD